MRLNNVPILFVANVTYNIILTVLVLAPCHSEFRGSEIIKKQSSQIYESIERNEIFDGEIHADAHVVSCLCVLRTQKVMHNFLMARITKIDSFMFAKNMQHQHHLNKISRRNGICIDRF